MFEYILIGSGFAFAAAVQPGPLTIYLISEAAKAGWRRTLPAVFAPLLSDGPVAVLMVFLLSRAPASFVQLLSLPGGLYVLYLAVGAWRSRRLTDSGHTPARRDRRVIKAALVNLLNPNVYLGWGLVLGPLLLSAWRESPGRGIAVILTFYTTMIACMAAIVVLVHVAGRLVPQFNRTLVGVSAVALAGFGLCLLGQFVRFVVS